MLRGCGGIEKRWGMNIIITKPQKKILLYVSIGAIIILIFWRAVYLPSRRQVQKFQSQLEKVEKQLNKIKEIEEIKEAISKGYIYTQSIEDLKGELAAVSKSIATEEETSLDYISSSARDLNLEVLSIKPAAKMLLLDKNKNRIKIAGAECFQLPVNLRLRGGYKAIGDYIESLRKDAPSLTTIENLRINKSRGADTLAADVSLIIYLKSAEK